MNKFHIVTIGLLVAGLAPVKAADAAANYKEHCAKCHGDDGKGQTKMGQKLAAKDYTTAKVQADLKDADALKAIKDGFKDKKTDKQLMKPTEGLNEQEMKDLVAYMRKFGKKDK